MAHDVFISYSTGDKATADAICATLEARNVRCWIAPRDVLPGSDWAASIMGAIASGRVMVVLFSANANGSRQIMREVERAVAEGLVIIPFRLQDVPFSKNLAYFLSACHWLDALDPPLEQHINRLADTVATFLTRGEAAFDETTASEASSRAVILREEEQSARLHLSMARQQLAVFLEEQNEHPERFMQDQIEIFEDDVRKYEDRLKEIRRELRRLRK